MSEKNGTAVIAKKRAAVFKEMNKATQAVAEQFEGLLSRANRGTVMIQFDLGEKMRDVMDNEGKYGSHAAEQLAAYLNIPGGPTLLYALRQFAESFEKEFVNDQMSRVMAGGGYLTISHWLALSKVEDKKKQQSLLKSVFENGWGANALEAEIRAGGGTKHARQGGRRPSAPTSPIAGLQKTFSLCQQLNNWEKVAVKHVFDTIDEITPDKVSKQMVDKLQETLTQATATKEKADILVKRLKGNLDRAQRVLEQKYEAAEKGRQEVEGEAPAKKKKGGKKAKKKAGSRRPAAATAAA